MFGKIIKSVRKEYINSWEYHHLLLNCKLVEHEFRDLFIFEYLYILKEYTYPVYKNEMYISRKKLNIKSHKNLGLYLNYIDPHNRYSEFANSITYFSMIGSDIIVLYSQKIKSMNKKALNRILLELESMSSILKKDVLVYYSSNWFCENKSFVFAKLTVDI